MENPRRALSGHFERFPQPTTTSWKTSDVFLSPLENRALTSDARARFPTDPQSRLRRGSFFPILALTSYRGTPREERSGAPLPAQKEAAGA